MVVVCTATENTETFVLLPYEKVQVMDEMMATESKVFVIMANISYKRCYSLNGDRLRIVRR